MHTGAAAERWPKSNQIKLENNPPTAGTTLQNDSATTAFLPRRAEWPKQFARRIEI